MLSFLKTFKDNPVFSEKHGCRKKATFMFCKKWENSEHLQEIRPNLACSKWLDFGGLFKIYQI